MEAGTYVRKNALKLCCKKQKCEIKMPQILNFKKREIKMQRKINVLQYFLPILLSLALGPKRTSLIF